MGRYKITNKAVDDLSAIWNYTYEVWSEKQANKYYYDILDFCNELAKNPSRGKIYEKTDKEILGYKIGQHIIFYRINPQKEIEILRILHSSMDLKNRIKE